VGTTAEPELELLVHQLTWEADGVLSLVLVATGGAELPRWEPGAHVDVLTGNGMVRQYSLCGQPGDQTRWRLAVLRESDGRGGSAWVHDSLRPGQRLRVRGPRNHFPLLPAARYLFIAGGIGITPILPMVATVAARGAEWELAYGGRARSTMAFTGELARFGDRVRVVAEDESGLLDLDTLLGAARLDTAVYCCGPEGLLAAVEQRCAAWPAAALHIERFRPKETVTDAPVGPFTVVLKRSERVFEIGPDQSILGVVEDAGIEVLYSCFEGICGTCETRVLEGVPDHRDSVLSGEARAANETMMICVSRARSPQLVLDL
jgi:ferredoxin-NADP reductase